MGGPDGRPRSTLGHLHFIDKEAFNLRVPTRRPNFFLYLSITCFSFSFPPRLVFIALSIIV